MERRNDIRAAMHSLLSPTRRDPEPPKPPRPEPPTNGHRTIPVSAPQLKTRAPQGKVIAEIQSTLREFGIQAEPSEIADILMEALMDRPALCRGLFASQLVGAK